MVTIVGIQSLFYTLPCITLTSTSIFNNTRI